MINRNRAIALSVALAAGAGSAYFAARKLCEAKPLTLQPRLQLVLPEINSNGDSHPACYKASLAEGKPFDYYLWPGARSCPDSFTKPPLEMSCAPERPRVLKTGEEITAFEQGAVRPDLPKLPYEPRQLEALLRQADKAGEITWETAGIYSSIQREIDSAGPEQDVHLVCGFGHQVEGQNAFFNELLTDGSDGRKIHGLTHVAFEFNGVDSEGHDMQTLLDRFTVTGDKSFKPVLQAAFWPGTYLPKETANEIESKSQTLEIGAAECYNLVFADLPGATSDKIKTSLGEYLWLGAREISAVQQVARRQDPSKKDVVAWRWGASHAEAQRLPFYIKLQDPQAKVVSIIINGGTHVEALAFDRVLKRLGWEEKTFIWKVQETRRDAGYVIHLPTEGRRVMWGISTERNPVIQHLFDPSK